MVEGAEKGTFEPAPHGKTGRGSALPERGRARRLSIAGMHPALHVILPIALMCGLLGLVAPRLGLPDVVPTIARPSPPPEPIISQMINTSDFLVNVAIGLIVMTGATIFAGKSHHTFNLIRAAILFSLAASEILSLWCSFSLRVGIIQQLGYAEFNVESTLSRLIWQAFFVLISATFALSYVFHSLFGRTR